MLRCLLLLTLYFYSGGNAQALYETNLQRFLERHPIQKDPHECEKNTHVEGRWIYNSGNQAGLNDRISIIRQLLDLSAATCTRLMFPIPCKSLSEKHTIHTDYNRTLSCDHSWDHYIQLSHPWLLIELNGTKPIGSEQFDYFNVPYFYSWEAGREEIRKLPRKVVHVNTTSQQDAFADSIIRNQGASDDFYALHVRRTDVKKICDTRVGKVLAHVKGILRNDTVAPAYLFYMTDETDRRYNKELMQALEATPKILKVVHVDPVVTDVIRNEPKVDNYFAYQVAKAIARKSKVFIELTHKGRCPKTLYYPYTTMYSGTSRK